MNVEYSRQAAKAISRMDRPTKQRIKAAIDGIPNGDIKQLVGADNTLWLRVGYWRILFSYVDSNIIYIMRIAPRGEAYKGV